MPASPAPSSAHAPTWLRRLGGGLALLGGAYLATLAALWFGQESLLFRPQALPSDHVLAREPDVHETTVAVPGAQLSMLELRHPEPHGVVFYLHGNAGNLATWFVNTGLYREAGFDLVMLDYRGYGKSSGRISSQAQLHDDVRAAWRQVAPRYVGRAVVVMGRSLGTGLAVELAREIQPDLTVLVSPYLSMQALAAQHYPWVPEVVLRYPLRTDQAVGDLRASVLLVHGDRDDLIPPSHSQALHGLARQARLSWVAGAGHNDLQAFPAYRQTLLQALTDLR